MRIRRLLAVGFAGALVSAAAIAAMPTAQAGITGTVDPTITDGSPNSLRDVLENQVVDGDTVTLQAGATYQLTDCEGGDIDVDAAVTIEGNGATIEQTCQDRVLYTDSGDLTIRNTTLTGGDASGEGGAIESDSGNVVLEGVTITGNASTSDGGGLDANEDVTVVDSTFVDNRTGGDGGAIDTSEGSETVRIVGSTLASNCAASDGGAVSTQSNDAVTVVNSTVTGNTSADSGALDAQHSGVTLTLVYADVVGNTLDSQAECGLAPGEARSADNVDAGAAVQSLDGANIDLADEQGGSTLESFGSVVSNPIGAVNCATENGTTLTSSGYNYSDDDSCGFTAATDKQNAASPQLGSLANNGGPTSTLLPADTSPLVNAIPTAACSGGDALAGSTITTDQRGLVRPDVVNQQCDIGAVELQTEPVVIQPTFTG